MKRILIVLIILGVVGLIVFTLFKNKSEMTLQTQRPGGGGSRGGGFSRGVAVAVAPVTWQTVHQTLTQQGSIVANNDVAVVSDLQTQGRVIRLMVQQGSTVAAGTPLLQVESQVPQANFLTAQINLEKAQKDLDRSISLNKDGLISDSQVESARQTVQAANAQYIAAQRQYNHAVITAPIGGVVSSLPVNLGTMVNSGMTVANIVDISTLKVKLNVPETAAFQLKTGDSAVVETDVYPGVKLTGAVSFIGVKGDDAHTYPVEVRLPNQKQTPLKSGMFGKVTFDFGAREALTVPRDAIVGSIENPQVYVVQDGVAKLTDIQVGSALDSNVVVLQGLNEGDQVVISGQLNLKDNTPVMIGSNDPGQNMNGGGWQGRRGQGNGGGQGNGSQSGWQGNRGQGNNLSNGQGRRSQPGNNGAGNDNAAPGGAKWQGNSSGNGAPGSSQLNNPSNNPGPGSGNGRPGQGNIPGTSPSGDKAGNNPQVNNGQNNAPQSGANSGAKWQGNGSGSGSPGGSKGNGPWSGKRRIPGGKPSPSPAGN